MWWYDRQGAIESTALNFVQDLPSFLVLLMAFQRFTLTDWGFNKELFPDADSHHRVSSDSDSPKRRNNAPFNLDFPQFQVTTRVEPTNLIYNQYSLLGRATRLARATGQSQAQDPARDLSGMKLVVKISWPEESRTNEADIIKAAQARGKDDELIRDHLPDLICWRNLGYSTGLIREELPVIEWKRRPLSGSRCLRVTVFDELEPITILEGDSFMQAWIECYRCECDPDPRNMRK